MSMLYEQRRALKRARDLLCALVTRTEPKSKKALRASAYSALRHFPFLKEDGEPMWSKH